MTGIFQQGLDKGHRSPIVAAAIGTLFCLVALAVSGPSVAQAYWMAWLFWTGVSFGALTLLMLLQLTGGAWGEAIRAPAEAAAQLIPFTAVLLVPVLFRLHDLFPWMNRDLFATRDWPHKQEYLTAPWFIFRGIGYMTVLTACTAGMGLWSRSGSPRPRAATMAAGGLLLYATVMLFASTDWVLSLEPEWYSTMFFLILAASQFLSALAFTVVVVSWRKSANAFSAAQWNDLGNLLLAFVIFWAYVTFSQFLIIWAGNLPREISWYLHRSTGGWPGVALLLAILQFGVPFALLLSRAAKRHPRTLRWIALLIFAANSIHLWWLTAPAFRRTPFTELPLDLCAFVLVGGIWLLLFNLFHHSPPPVATEGVDV